MKILNFMLLPFALLPGLLGAAEFTVDVRDFSFSPEVVEIQVGDTVTWTNSMGFHNVAAQDGSFTNGPPSNQNWTFSRTFTAADDEILYQCDQHPGMIGAITVTDPDVFNINYGITGSWYEAATSGQGMSIEYIPSTAAIVMYWFTYDLAGGKQQWLIGSGTIVGNTVMLTVVRPEGGIFNVTSTTVNSAWGTATLTFNSCTSATLVYQSDLDLVADTIDLTRLSADLVCASGGLIDE